MTMENKIKELRKLKRLSQDQLAQVCGVSRQTINAIENLEVRVDELFLFRSRT